MFINLHNHTPLCNHATGTPLEYIKEAIKHNIKYFAFSDHAPMNFDEKYRMKETQKLQYEKNILQLKEEYKNDINILLSYEVDYIKDHMREDVLNANVDFLIGSVHFLNGWGFDNYEYIKEYKNRNIDDVWIEYFDTIEKMANTGYFDVVGHLDLIKVFKFFPKKSIKSIAFNSLKAIKKNNMVVEVNSAGLRKKVKEQYPSKELLQLCYELDIDITFSSDAHSIKEVGVGLDSIYSIAKDIGYTKAVVFDKKDRSYVEI